METKSTIYRRSADNGFWLGLVFIIMFATMVLSEQVSLLSIVTMALFFCVPFLVFLFFRRSYNRAGYKMEYAELWVEGILSFVCGGAILAVAVYMFLKIIDPEYIVRQVDLFLDIYKDIDDGRAEEVVDILELIKENNAYPTPRLISIQLFLTTIFTGSILSMVIAVLIKSLKIRR